MQKNVTDEAKAANSTFRTVRFHKYGEPADVLQLDEAPLPQPAAGRIRVRVQACGLNPADWALCRGLFQGNLPRGVGLDVSGIVDAVGEGVNDVAVGDQVLGTADYAGSESAGVADYTIMNHWAIVPPGLDLIEAAALPMAVETAFRSLEDLGVTDKHTILIHGAGSMVGFAAVQIALLRGAKVIATAGETFAPKLRKLGATVTAYGEGMVERVREIAGGSPDLILDTAPISGALPDLVKIADGDAQRVLTISDFAAAKELGARDSFTKSKHDAAARFDQDGKDVAKAAADFLRYDILGDYAKLAAEGKFSVPIARTYALKDWRQAMEVSQSGNPHGKIMILPTE